MGGKEIGGGTAIEVFCGAVVVEDWTNEFSGVSFTTLDVGSEVLEAVLDVGFEVLKEVLDEVLDVRTYFLRPSTLPAVAFSQSCTLVKWYNAPMVKTANIRNTL